MLKIIKDYGDRPFLSASELFAIPARMPRRICKAICFRDMEGNTRKLKSTLLLDEIRRKSKTKIIETDAHNQRGPDYAGAHPRHFSPILLTGPRVLTSIDTNCVDARKMFQPDNRPMTR